MVDCEGFIARDTDWFFFFFEYIRVGEGRVSNSESSDDGSFPSREFMDIWEVAGDNWLNGVKFVVELLVPEFLPFVVD